MSELNNFQVQNKIKVTGIVVNWTMCSLNEGSFKITTKTFFPGCKQLKTCFPGCKQLKTCFPGCKQLKTITGKWRFSPHHYFHLICSGLYNCWYSLNYHKINHVHIQYNIIQYYTGCFENT